jgi:hypothetical protein
VHGCLRGRHQPPHDGASRGEPSTWTTLFAEFAVQQHQRNWLGSRPGRDTLGVRVLSAIGTYSPAPAFGLNSWPILSIVRITAATHGCSDQCCNVKVLLANSEPSTNGPSRRFVAARQFSRFSRYSGHGRTCCLNAVREYPSPKIS